MSQSGAEKRSPPKGAGGGEGGSGHSFLLLLKQREDRQVAVWLGKLINVPPCARQMLKLR